jgi:glycine cleavage system H protein
VIAPLSGKVIEVNDALKDNPEAVNNDPYGEGWIAKIELSNAAEAESLLDVDAYTKLIEG